MNYDHKDGPLARSNDANVAGRQVELAQAAQRCLLTGRLNDGVDLLLRALMIADHSGSSDHPDTVEIVRQLARTQSHLGRVVEAERLYRRILTWCEQHCAVDHCDTARACENLAAVLFRRGQYAESSQLQERAVLSYAKLYGAQDERTLEAVKFFVLAEGNAERERQAQVQKAHSIVVGDSPRAVARKLVATDIVAVQDRCQNIVRPGKLTGGSATQGAQS